jgi:hypothetical protein
VVISGGATFTLEVELDPKPIIILELISILYLFVVPLIVARYYLRSIGLPAHHIIHKTSSIIPGMGFERCIG